MLTLLAVTLALTATPAPASASTSSVAPATKLTVFPTPVCASDAERDAAPLVQSLATYVERYERHEAVADPAGFTVAPHSVQNQNYPYYLEIRFEPRGLQRVPPLLDRTPRRLVLQKVVSFYACVGPTFASWEALRGMGFTVSPARSTMYYAPGEGFFLLERTAINGRS